MLEELNHRVRLRSSTRVLIDGVDQVVRSPIMQEEDPLAESPKRRCAELIACGSTLRHTVGQVAAHVVHEQIGEEVDVCVVQARCECRGSGLQSLRVTKRAADLREDPRSIRDRGSSAWFRR